MEPLLKKAQNTKKLLILAVFLLFSSHAIQAKSEEASRLVDVLAQGAGLDAETAMNSAYRNAVQQAVGLYVDAETLVRNDELIRDQVLTHSRGLIESIEVLSEGMEDGIYRVHIRAQVLRQPLEERMAPVLSDRRTINIDGASRLAAAASREHQEQDARALFDEAISILSQPDWIEFRIHGEPRISDNNDVIEVDVEMFRDPEAYAVQARRASEILHQIAISHRQMVSNQVKNLLSNERKDGLLYLSSFSQQPQWGESVFLLQNFITANRMQRRWDEFKLPFACEVESNKLRKNAILTLEVLDQSENPIAFGSHRFSGLRLISGGRRSCASTHDIVRASPGSIAFREKSTGTVRIMISPEQITQVASVRLSAHFEPAR